MRLAAVPARAGAFSRFSLQHWHLPELSAKLGRTSVPFSFGLGVLCRCCQAQDYWSERAQLTHNLL